MTPEQLKRFEEMEQKLKSIEQGFRNLSQIDPQFAQSIIRLIYTPSSEVVTNYDRSVNESGSSSYNVPNQFDGLLAIEGDRLIGYYNKL